MVNKVSSNQVLTSEASYRAAMLDAQRIERAVEWAAAGKQVVDLSKYIERFSTLYTQFDTRTKLGINANLQKLHEEFGTALRNLSGKVVAVATKISLDAAKRAANAPKPSSPSKPWNMRQIIKYGAIGVGVTGVVVLAPQAVLNQVKNIPHVLPITSQVWQGMPRVFHMAQTLGSLFATALISMSNGLNVLRGAANKAGIPSVTAPPSNPPEQVGDGVSFLLCTSACTFGMGAGSWVLPKGLVSIATKFLPSSWFTCTAICAAEAVREGITGELLNGAKNAVTLVVEKAKDLAQEYGPPVVDAAKGAAASSVDTAKAVVKTATPFAQVFARDLQSAWNATATYGPPAWNSVAGVVRRTLPPALSATKTGMHWVANKTTENPELVVRSMEGVGGFIVLERLAEWLLPPFRRAVLQPNLPAERAGAEQVVRAVRERVLGGVRRAIPTGASAAKTATAAREAARNPGLRGRVRQVVVVTAGAVGAAATAIGTGGLKCARVAYRILVGVARVTHPGLMRRR